MGTPGRERDCRGEQDADGDTCDTQFGRDWPLDAVDSADARPDGALQSDWMNDSGARGGLMIDASEAPSVTGGRPAGQCEVGRRPLAS